MCDMSCDMEGGPSVFNFLPPAKHVSLAQPPLVKVIAQVRFSSQGALATHAGASLMHDQIAHRYPRLLSEQQQVITAVAGGPVTTSAVPQWRMADFDNTWSCVVGPEQVTLETTAYARWESMHDRLNEILDALSTVTSPRVRERIGLRYVNEIPPGPDGSHRGRVRSEFLGPAGIDSWRPGLAASMSQTVLRDNPLQLAMRYGVGVEQSNIAGSFILDLDCADEQPVRYDAKEILEYFDVLNDVAYRCFCACVLEDYRQGARDG